MKCFWTKRALNEYKKVVDYIIQNFGRKAALDFVSGVSACDERILKFPEIGAPEPLLKGRKNVYHSFIVSKHNKVIYTIDSNRKVTIVDMWDMRRQPTKLASRIKS